MAKATLDGTSPNSVSDTAVTTGGLRAIEIRQVGAAVEFHASVEYWDWMQLFERDPSALLSQHPDHVLLEIADPHASASRPTYLVKCVSDGSTTGIGILVPKDCTAREVIGFGPACKLKGFRLAGNRFLGDASDEIQQELLRATSNHVRSVGGAFLLIEDVIEASPLWNLCESDARGNFQVFHPNGVQPRLRIRFPQNPEDYWRKFKSKRRWNFRKTIKNFGEHRFDRVTDVGQLAEFLQGAHRISKNSWQAQYLGLRVRNDDAELELFTFLATQGALRSYILHKGDTPSAFIIGTQHNGCYDYAEIGYDLEFKKFSPGQVLLLQMLEDLIQHDTPTQVDFGDGDAEYKQIFANDESRSGNIWLVPPGIRSAAMLAYVKSGLGANRMARRMLAGSGLWRRVRQWTRGGSVRS